MKIYISGRITGNAHYKAEFEEAAELIRSMEAEPVNPAVAPDGWTYKRYIDAGLELLEGCDAILMLPGWGLSRGAQLERHYALTVGMPILETVRKNGKLGF